MRTTVTIDADVEALLRKTMRERDASFKQVLNNGLRQGLAASRTRRPVPFKQRTVDMGAPLIDLTKATALAAELEDAELVGRMRAAR